MTAESKKSRALDVADLDHILTISAVASLVIAVCAWVVVPHWAGLFAAIAALGIVNWYALSRIFLGAFGGDLKKLATGVLLKPPLLALILLIGANGALEITSFLLGFNMFFITLFGYLIYRSASK